MKTEEQYRLDESIAYQIYNRSLTLKALFDRAYKKAGMQFTSDQSLIIIRLGEKEGVSQRELAETTLKDKPRITRIIDSLEKLKVLERRSHPNDRRSNKVYLTKQGKRIYKEIIHVMIRLRKSMPKPLSEKESRKILKYLDKLVENYQAMEV